MNIHRFTVEVACPAGRQENYADHCLLLLPESYSPTGRATRLVISCHGAGGTVSADNSQTEQHVLTHYLLANGYAVMDANGLPEAYGREVGIDLCNNVGSPVAMDCYVKAYHYCMEHFNLRREVFMHGGSMGGLTSTNLVLSRRIPVIAHTAFCPVLDTYNEVFLHPWSNGLPRTALAKLYGLAQDAEGNYLYDADRIGEFDPAVRIKGLSYPVPVAFWHCKDDPTVSYAVTCDFVRAVNEGGGRARLVSLERGGHEPTLVGPPVAQPTGKNHFDGRELVILPAVEEVFRQIHGMEEHMNA